MLGWRKIGCGIDFSEPSRLAMLKAAELARRLDGDLELVHVHEPPPAVASDMLVTGADVGAAALVDAEKRMATWRDEATRLVGRPVRSTVLPGEPAGEIVRLAREQGLDLLVLGTHGWKGLKRLLVGSVAERVVHQAPCAVLVVRRPPAEAGARTDTEAGARGPERS